MGWCGGLGRARCSARCGAAFSLTLCLIVIWGALGLAVGRGGTCSNTEAPERKSASQSVKRSV